MDANLHPNCHVGYILSLGVCSAFRRQGVASLLLDSFLGHVKLSENHLCKAIYLHVLTMNSAAIRFYEKHNFRFVYFNSFFLKYASKNLSVIDYTASCHITTRWMESVKMDSPTSCTSMVAIHHGVYYILFPYKLF